MFSCSLGLRVVVCWCGVDFAGCVRVACVGFGLRVLCLVMCWMCWFDVCCDSRCFVVLI